MVIELQDFPDSVRVQLSPASEDRLWQAVEDTGGITAVAAQHGYSRSRLYNWKHKDTFLPVAFVRPFLDDPAVTAVKGGGRSRPWNAPSPPVPVDDELLTRIDASVHVNRDGVPIYQTDDPGLVQRFVTLVERYGDIPFSVYRRTIYEIRYPKYFHDILQTADYSPVFAAQADETGHVADNQVIAGGDAVPVDQFDGTLHHRGKKLQLALARGDTAAITSLMASEAAKVQQLVAES